MLKFSEPVAPDGIAVTADGRIELRAGGKALVPEAASISISYPRPKGDKLLTRVPQATHHVRQEIEQVLQRFDIFFAIDTSVGRIGEEAVATTAVVLGRWNEGRNEVHHAPTQGLEFRKPTSATENIGWMLVIEMIQSHPERLQMGHVGIIVDSDLSNLDAYNRRVAPIVWDQLLPSGMQFIYASADAGTENVPNQLIRSADRAAKGLLRHVLTTPREDGLISREQVPFSRIRDWTCERSHRDEELRWTIGRPEQAGE